MSPEPHKIRRSTVTTTEGEISYIHTGDGPTALFVHGIATGALFWENVIREIGGSRRCIALDLPLHGETPARADQDFSIGGLADVVEAFCQSLDLTEIDLVANDTGGAVAQVFAARHPERLRTFTLTNCDTHDNVPPEAFKPTVELAKSGAVAPMAPALLADLVTARTTVFGPGYEDPEFLDLETVRAFLEPVGGTPERARQFEQLIAGLEPTDLLAAEPALAQLTVPTLIVWGTADEFFELRWAYWLRDTIPGTTEVVEIAGAKLFFPNERARDLAPHLLRHWAAADRRRVGTP
jgi:pimeloyl-ACP methyl ester carboxylesterase